MKLYIYVLFAWLVANGQLQAAGVSGIQKKQIDPSKNAAMWNAINGLKASENLQKLFSETSVPDINAKKMGDTPLIYVYDNYKDLIKVLLDLGADINASDLNGNTVLLKDSISFGNDAIDRVKLFIQRGANVNAKNKDGWTALMSAAQNGRNAIVKLLIAAGANVNAQANNSKTPLIIAADNGQLETIKLLLSAGADINIQDKNGKTALQYISAAKRAAFEKIIQDYEKLKTPEHKIALSGVAQKAMEGQMAKMGQGAFSGVTEDLSGEVSKYLR